MENKVLSVILSCPAESRKTVKQPFQWGILLLLIFNAMCQFPQRLQKSGRHFKVTDVLIQNLYSSGDCRLFHAYFMYSMYLVQLLKFEDIDVYILFA